MPFKQHNFLIELLRGKKDWNKRGSTKKRLYALHMLAIYAIVLGGKFMG
jgi:hypothetical protein